MEPARTKVSRSKEFETSCILDARHSSATPASKYRKPTATSSPKIPNPLKQLTESRNLTAFSLKPRASLQRTSKLNLQRKYLRLQTGLKRLQFEGGSPPRQDLGRLEFSHTVHSHTDFAHLSTKLLPTTVLRNSVPFPPPPPQRPSQQHDHVT